MSMPITVRPASESDYGGIMPIAAQVHKLHTDNRADIYRETATPLGLDEFTTMLGSPEKYRIIVACGEAGKILGYAVIQIQDTRDVKLLNDARVHVVDSIATDEGHKRQGIGKAMMDYIRGEASSDKAERIVLNVLSFNKEAMDFYEKLGMRRQAIKYEFVL